MKKKFTILITAALALLTMIVQPGKVMGQSDYSTDYTGNITLSATGGTSASACKVVIGTTQYDGIKAGTSGTAGAMKISVPSGTKYLHIHAAAWNNTTASLVVTPTGYSDNIALTSNSGISSNSPFTFSGDPSTTNYYKVITFTNALTENTELTFTASGGKRFVIWGVTSEEEGSGSETPSISASNVEIAYDAIGGSIAYTINNEPSPAGTLTATVTDGDWLTLGQGTTSPISFNCTANETTIARTATVTLTYTYGEESTVTKDVTVTQAAAPMIYTTIPDIFTAATSTETYVLVTFNNWVVSGVSTNGKNVFVTDNNGNGFVIFDNAGNLGATYAAGDILSGTSVPCTLVLYTGFAELKNVDATNLTISEGGTLTEITTIALADLSGVNTGALIHYDNLTSSANNKLTDGTTTLQLYNALYAYDALTVNNTYNITGVYQQFNNTKEILPRSADDIEEVTIIVPTIIIVNATANVPAEGGDGTLTVSYENITNIDAEVYFCDALGEAATYSWIIADIDADNNVEYIIDPNDSEARTAYFKVHQKNSEVYSNLVTVNQAAYVAPTPAIAVTPTEVNATAAETEGTIDVTLTAIYNDYIEVEWFESDGTTAATYNHDWIQTDITTEKDVYYVIGENTGDARSAYFKVYGLDGDTHDVYSELVTINQAAPVTPGTWVLTDLADLTANDIFVIVGDNGDTYAMPYNGGSQSGAPAAVAIAIANDALTAEPAAELQWNISGNATDGYVFYPNGNTESWLYCTATNNGVRVGTNDNKTFVLDSESGYLQNTATSRYVGIYNSQDWRCYTNTTGNIAGQTFAFYKKVTGPVPVVPTITITPPEVTNVPAAGDVPEHTVTLANMTVTSTDDFEFVYCDSEGNILGNEDPKPNWIELADAEYVSAGENVYTMVYTVAENNKNTPRSGYFKIGVEQSSGTVYSNLVTVTQEAYVAPVASITVDPDLVEAPADETEGNLAMTLENITISQVEDHFEVYFCDSEGTILGPNDDKPNWLIGEVQLEGGVFSLYYLIDENTDSEPRTAYMKVYGLSDDASTEAYSNLVTVTQAGLVVDYATLPFEWEGGLPDAFDALNGTTLSGVGSYPNQTTYQMKLDGTDDFIMVKTDSQPAKVTIGVKMIGGASTSKLTVKASTDGEAFDEGEELTISGKQNDILNLETTRTFASDVRYVKMIFTKGSNVGVGPITITKYTTDPVINAEDVDLTYDATSGEIAYTITNPVAGKNLEATTSATWISNIAVSEEKVSFTTTANEGSEDRVATFTLTYEGAADKTVTVTQAHIDYATLPFEFTGGKADIENTDGLTENGIDNSDYSGVTTKLKFNTTGDWLQLKLNEAPTSLSYDIKGNNFSSGTFTVQTSANGEDYTDLITFNNSNLTNNIQSITHINLDADVRYIKWIFFEKGTGNVGIGNIHASDEYEIYGDMTINSDDLAAQPVIVHNGSVVTFVGTNTNAADLIIEDGGQLIHDGDGVQATIQKNITGYNTSRDAGNSAYQLIASPVADPLIVATETNLTTSGEFDLYIFDQGRTENRFEWRNYKQTGEFTTIDNGKGYLYANANNATISFAGTFKPSASDVTVNLAYTDGNRFAGWNLVGNPFACNAYAKDTIGKTLAFYKMNSSGDGFVAVTTGAIAPMEGVFVKASETGQSFAFTRQAPVSSPGKGNLIIQVAQAVTGRDAQHISDNAIIRFDGGNTLEKFSFSEDNAKLYIPQNGKDYAVVSADTQGEMPVNFKAAENGTYTIDFSMDNVEFSYLHLIDNKTGMDIDLLQTSSYTFEASKIDYASRFKLVFSTNSNSNSNDDNDFAFFDANGNLLILGNEGTATLQVIDITGRTVSNETFSGNYSKAINAKAGVYMLRLIQGNDVRTQKIVVR